MALERVREYDGADSTHLADRRGAVVGDVADHEELSTVGEFGGVEPVSPGLRRLVGRPVRRRNRHAGQRRDLQIEERRME